MNIYTLIRQPEEKDGTFGHLYDPEGEVLACTVEKHWHNNQQRISCIPKGKYEVERYLSPSKGNCFHIKDVPNRDYILIHVANWEHELLGCIGVGYAFIDNMLDKKTGLTRKGVTLSRKKMDELLDTLPDKFTLDIR